MTSIIGGLSAKDSEFKTKCNASIFVFHPELKAEKITLNKTANENDEVIFTINVTNTGNCDLDDITVTETIPKGLTYLGISGNGWNESKESKNKYKYSSILAPGQSTSFNITFKANGEKFGNIENLISITSNMTEEITAKNTTFINKPENQTNTTNNTQNKTDNTTNNTNSNTKIKETPTNTSIQITSQNNPSKSVELTKEPEIISQLTGNPVYLLLIVLLIASNNIRRKIKK